jgi:hypothetical protein
VKFYEEAEAVLAQTPRHGVPIVLKPARGKKASRALHSAAHVEDRIRAAWTSTFHRHSRWTHAGTAA